ncbi:MAG: HPF/RaiA family ribosome-associated protein [Burkholderiales bacterium]|nr:ribosome-associated translation inhibitor RaiA [Ferrovum sp.]
MQIPLQITTHNMDHSDALEARIRAKTDKLSEFFQHITSSRVTVELEGKQFRVRSRHQGSWQRDCG